jgi:hypothetical protein
MNSDTAVSSWVPTTRFGLVFTARGGVVPARARVGEDDDGGSNGSHIGRGGQEFIFLF